MNVLFLFCKNWSDWDQLTLAMGLFSESKRYAQATGSFNVLMLLICVSNIIIPIVRSEMLIHISNGKTELVTLFLAFSTVEISLGTFVIKPMTTRVSFSVEIQFIKYTMVKYASLIFDAKNTRPSTKFARLRNEAASAMFRVVEWGLPYLTQMMGALVSVVWVFYRKNMGVAATLFFAVGFVMYMYLIHPRQKEFTVAQKSCRVKNEVLKEKSSLNASAFQYKERSPEFMSDLMEQRNANEQSLIDVWRDIMIRVSGGSQLLNLFVCWSVASDAGTFMVVFITMEKFSGIIKNMCQFGTQYNRLTNDFDALDAFWPEDSSDYMDEPARMYPVPGLVVENINIRRDDFHGRLARPKPIPFHKGVKILFQGPSGSGKTTVVNAMLGKIGGVTFNIGNPSNYYHGVADMFQSIGKKLPMSKISIRDYFKEEPSNYIIESHLRDMFPSKEYDYLMAMLKNTKHAKKSTGDCVIDVLHPSDVLHPTEALHPFDVHLDERPSGGQHMRLILATRSYEAIKFEKPIIVLDEPEQGTDPETIVVVMNRFFALHASRTIIMISHMCSCQMEQLEIVWNRKFYVEDGLIHEV